MKRHLVACLVLGCVFRAAALEASSITIGFNTNFGQFNAQGGITPNPTFGTPTGVITNLTDSGAPRRFQLGLNYGW